jgi:hypothetical protein
MNDTTASIPEPPREPRWRTCLGRRWVLGLVGGILVVDGLVMAAVFQAVEVGTELSALPLPVLMLSLLVAPGLVLLGWWYRAVLRLRILLREGSLSAGKVLTSDRIPGVNPPYLRVRYSFRDDAGSTKTRTQRVRARSELGQRILGGAQQLSVIYDPYEPKLFWIVIPEDFLVHEGLAG